MYNDHVCVTRHHEDQLTATLIVLAHPEPRSFNSAWAGKTQEVCTGMGDTVLTSNLSEMAFDPVESRIHYSHLAAHEPFDPLKAQETAAIMQLLPRDVVSEVDKLRRADRVVFHFPLWWFSPPAVLKGWFERVLAHGETHSVTDRFDRGQFSGRKALFCVTTGSQEPESAFDGREGDVQMLLWPLAYALRYVGFSVLVPETVHGVHGYHEGARRNALQARLQTVLDSQQSLLQDWDNRPELQFNSDDDFDARGRLKSDRPSHSYFIRHGP